MLLEGQVEVRECRTRQGCVACGEHERALGVLATPTIPVMLTWRAASAAATSASDPGRSSSWTVNQTVTPTPPRWMVLGEQGACTLSDMSPLPQRSPGAGGGAPGSGGAPVAAPSVQVFGLEDSQPTRAALRFFKERRAAIHFVDLRRKPIAPGELRRFVERLGAAALLDTESRPYRDQGLAYLRMEDEAIVERLLLDPRLLRLPLVRHGNEVTVGKAEAAWRGWFDRRS